MRLPKFLSIVTCITSFCLLYVWQQSEVFRFAYIGQKSQIKFQDLFDKNARLRYNIDRQVSLINIGSRISEDEDFQMPQTYRLVKSAYSNKAFTGLNKQVPKKQNLFASIFGIKKQAEAKVINPSIPLGIDAE